MSENEQEQTVGDGSKAYQAGRDINIGITYSDARDIALNVFDQNFYKLVDVAKEVATARAEEFTTAFLKQLQSENPAGLAQAIDPSFQSDLFVAQRAYAKSGEHALGEVLGNLLVERSKNENRDLIQVILSESISTVQKLTLSQISALSLILMISHITTDAGENVDFMGIYWDRFIEPHIKKLDVGISSYLHLEYAGCATRTALMNTSLSKKLGNTYQSFFTHGFKGEEVSAQGISIGLDINFFRSCPTNQENFIVAALDDSDLEEKYHRFGISSEDRKLISKLYESGKMSEAEIEQTCIDIRSYMFDIFRIWDKFGLGVYTLTSVGIAIGHANIKPSLPEVLRDTSTFIHGMSRK